MIETDQFDLHLFHVLCSFRSWWSRLLERSLTAAFFALLEAIHGHVKFFKGVPKKFFKRGPFQKKPFLLHFYVEIFRKFQFLAKKRKNIFPRVNGLNGGVPPTLPLALYPCMIEAAEAVVDKSSIASISVLQRNCSEGRRRWANKSEHCTYYVCTSTMVCKPLGNWLGKCYT